MCQDEGANVGLESDKEDEGEATGSKKVTFSLYSVSDVVLLSLNTFGHKNKNIYILEIKLIN